VCTTFALQQLYDEAEARQSRHHAGLGFGDGAASAAPAGTGASATPAFDPTAAAAAAAAIAARLAAQLGTRPAAPAVDSAPATSFDAAAASGGSVDINEAVARARAVAANLGLGGASVLGKRKADQTDFPWSRGDEQRERFRRKILVPTDQPDINFMGLLIGPKVRALACHALGARVAGEHTLHTACCMHCGHY
jgi:hypothetical protein